MKETEPTHWHAKNVIMYNEKLLFHLRWNLVSWNFNLTIELSSKKKLDKKHFILHALREICMQGCMVDIIFIVVIMVAYF